AENRHRVGPVRVFHPGGLAPVVLGGELTGLDDTDRPGPVEQRAIRDLWLPHPATRPDERNSLVSQRSCQAVVEPGAVEDHSIRPERGELLAETFPRIGVPRAR